VTPWSEIALDPDDPVVEDEDDEEDDWGDAEGPDELEFEDRDEDGEEEHVGWVGDDDADEAVGWQCLLLRHRSGIRLIQTRRR